MLIAIGVLRQREAGAAGVVFNHAEQLEKLGHQVDCWFFHDILLSPRWPARFRDLEFAVAVSSRIRRQPRQYDVVNLHAPWGCVYGLSRKWFPSAELPPYVFTMQGSEERFARAMKLEHQRGRTSNFAWKNRLWHRLYHQSMYDLSISTANYGAVANREGWVLSELKYGHPPGRIWYVPNGVNENFFLPREFTTRSANRLLYVGTWLDRKGIRYLADAFAALAARSPEVHLTIAGCIIPEEQVKAHFPAEIHNRISVLPFLARDAMPALYAAHDIFVFPSLVEGMPLTLLEAMAGAMPVVTTNTCGMSDLIDDETNGLLVPAADAAALGNAIDRLRSSPELRRTLGLRAQASARRYTWDRIARQLEQVFQLAVESRRQARSL
ncbi:MAG TPA: glycosyltransferase family 4 protein [Candidatus Acidoferrum sp.]|jgi:glycosyltransferase involved in cell wall biosynthesis|nr:glycosyltransferase family 4 protein [Candidatus Acidoferrum sp.]